MNAVRIAACVLLTGSSLVLACSSESLESDGTSSGSSGSRGRDGGRSEEPSSSSSSGIVSSSTSSGFVPDPSAGGRIDSSRVHTLTLRKDTCNRPSGTCMDAHSFTVDFKAQTLTSTTCVELASFNDAGGDTTDAETTRPLDEKELDSVRAALDAVRVNAQRAPFQAAGSPTETLEFQSTDGIDFAFATNSCAPDDARTLTSSFADVYKVVADLSQR